MYIININDAWKDMQLQNFTSQGSNFLFSSLLWKWEFKQMDPLLAEWELKRIDHWLAVMMTLHGNKWKTLSHKTASEQHVDQSTDPGDANGFWKKLKHHFS